MLTPKFSRSNSFGKLAQNIAFCAVALILCTTNTMAQVTGTIDKVAYVRNALEVSGWACDTGQLNSILVHAYIGGGAGKGTLIAYTRANLPSEAAISTQCNTSLVNHRYLIKIPRDSLKDHEGEQIYVHGIRITVDGINSLLTNSGLNKVPQPLPVGEYKLSEKIAKLTSPFDVTIERDEVVTIDTNADLGQIMVMGQLKCPATGNYSLKSEGIMIHGNSGLFECGNTVNRFAGSLKIYMKNGRALSDMEGKRAISVMMGGTLRLVGQQKNFNWQRISATINPGDRTIKLSKPVDWSAGDLIAVGSTSFNFAEAEERIIESVSLDKLILTVQAPFTYRHNGVANNYAQGTRSWTLDERAEVANLTRNILIAADEDAATLDNEKIGAHVMVMKSGFGFIDGVEFTRVGQLGIMGKYPFHWHLAGDVPGQYIRNSSIHNSYQRCITVHGTNKATVENNICYDHFGHGYFLENGNETENMIIGNLGMKSKRAPMGKGLLATDMFSPQGQRYSAPATFWISNPKNTVQHNVASGSQGTGFWNAFSQALNCSAMEGICVYRAPTDPDVEVRPALEKTTVFSNNVAHSCTVGFTWDGAEDGALINNPLNPRARVSTQTQYAPLNQEPVFTNLTAFKNVFSGIYFRGNTSTFSNAKLADNGISLFIAYHQIIKDSLIVGASPNFLDSDAGYFASQARATLQSVSGSFLYDGPLELHNVHFADFTARKIPYSYIDAAGATVSKTLPIMPIRNGGGANRFIAKMSQLTFSPEPPRRFYPEGDNPVIGWVDTPWTTGLRDVDGSLDGVANRTLVPNHELNQDPSCAPMSFGSSNMGMKCDYEMGVITLIPSKGFEAMNKIQFNVERFNKDGKAAGSNLSLNFASVQFHNKTGVLLDKGYVYKFTLIDRPSVLRLRFQTEQLGRLSPAIDLSGYGTNCKPTSLSGTPLGASLSGVGLVKVSTVPAYYSSGSQLILKAQTERISGMGGSNVVDITILCDSN